MTKSLGLPVRAKSPCPLFVVRGWLLREMVSEFMKIYAKLETSMSRHIDCVCSYDGQRTTDNRQAKPQNGSQRAESAFFTGNEITQIGFWTAASLTRLDPRRQSSRHGGRFGLRGHHSLRVTPMPISVRSPVLLTARFSTLGRRSFGKEGRYRERRFFFRGRAVVPRGA